MIARFSATGPCHGVLRLDGLEVACAVGRGGVTRDKREGDGATPVGLLPLRRVLFRADRVDRPPATVVPCAPMGRDDLWCDDVFSRAYNTLTRAPCSDRHEALWRDDGVYDVIGVLGWNDAPVERGRGSAIFLHVADAKFGPTAGCLALTLPDVLRVLGAGVTGVLVPG